FSVERALGRPGPRRERPARAAWPPGPCGTGATHDPPGAPRRGCPGLRSVVGRVGRGPLRGEGRGGDGRRRRGRVSRHRGDDAARPTGPAPARRPTAPRTAGSPCGRSRRHRCRVTVAPLTGPARRSPGRADRVRPGIRCRGGDTGLGGQVLSPSRRDGAGGLETGDPDLRRGPGRSAGRPVPRLGLRLRLPRKPAGRGAAGGRGEEMTTTRRATEARLEEYGRRARREALTYLDGDVDAEHLRDPAADYLLRPGK